MWSERTIQSRSAEDPRFVVGKGKLKEIVIEALRKGADLLVFDTELSPNQVRSIGDFTRDESHPTDHNSSWDIFAQRAKSREGKIQVELATTEVCASSIRRERRRPLTASPAASAAEDPERQKLEIDRRRIHSRISFLEKQINNLSKQRSLRRGLRNRRGTPVISIVGLYQRGKVHVIEPLDQVSGPYRGQALCDP